MHWIETTVGDYCPFIYGKGLPQKKRISGHYKVYGSNGCVDYHNESHVNGPGIIIGRKGSVGAIHLSLEPFWPIDTSFYIEKDSIEELWFAYYLLKSLGLENMNSDSAVPGLNRNNTHALPIKIPEKEEDRKVIGSWISKFDDKIQVNYQLNQTLEQIAQAIFKSWFVDFEPVKAKIRAREKWLQNHPDSFAATPPSQGVELTDSPPAKGEYAEGGRGLNNLKHLKMFRTKLRNKLTPAEAKLWTYLKNKQLKGRKFRRQHSVGNYILDFYCPAEKLAIELDGEVHNSETQAVYDQERSLFLAHYGIKVLRFENNVVFENPEGLLSKVQEYFNHPAPDGAPLLEKVNHPAPDGAPLLEKVNHPAPDGAPLLEKEGSLEEAMNLAAMSVISGKDETVLKQLQADRPEAYAKLKQTAALFPSAMQESELGEIPQGWSFKPLREIASITMGQSPKSEFYNSDGEGLPFHQGVTKFRFRFVEHERYCTKPTRLSQPGDILFSVRAPVGRMNITNDIIVLGRGLSAIHSIDGFQSFLFYALKSYFFKEDMIGGGSIYASVTKRDMENQELLIPSEPLLNEFNDFGSDIDKQIYDIHQINVNLTKARDFLLPKLLSGEITIDSTNPEQKSCHESPN